MDDLEDGSSFEPPLPADVDEEDELVTEEPSETPAVESDWRTGKSSEERTRGRPAHSPIVPPLSFPLLGCGRPHRRSAESYGVMNPKVVVHQKGVVAVTTGSAGVAVPNRNLGVLPVAA